jgi:lysyl-tRNA synthetase class 2
VEHLRSRAVLLRSIRAFFEERGSLEVETPALVRSPGVDAHLDAIEAGGGWLTTSPEYHMKRLLAAGSGPIFQIGKAWRAGEVGRLHEPEFTLLEWYSPGLDDQGLMDETQDLVVRSAEALGLQLGWMNKPFTRITWAEAFYKYLGFRTGEDPIRRLGLLLRSSGTKPPRGATGEDLEDLALALLIQPKLVEPTFVTDWPASRAALARLKADGSVAARFELYMSGLEICNGYHELTCPEEQRSRIETENHRRVTFGKTPYPVDEAFLGALEEGLPDCSGNALGVDRLQMALQGYDDIGGVRSFRTLT